MYDKVQSSVRKFLHVYTLVLGTPENNIHAVSSASEVVS